MRTKCTGINGAGTGEGNKYFPGKGSIEEGDELREEALK